MKLYILCFKDLTLTDIFEFEGNAWDLMTAISNLLNEYESIAVIEHIPELLLEFETRKKHYYIVHSDEFEKHGIFYVWRLGPDVAQFYIDTSKYSKMYRYRVCSVEFHLPGGIFLKYQRLMVKKEDLERIQDIISLLDYLFTFLEV